MRPNALAAALVLALAPAALAQAPAPAKAQAPPATTTARPATAPSPQLKQVLATVNGEAITRGDLVNFLSQYRIPAGDAQQLRTIYTDAIQSLVNNRLLYQFLNRQKYTISEERISERQGALERQLKQDGTDLATELQRSGSSRDELRKDLANQERWLQFLDSKATDAALADFARTHKDLFSGAQVKARHVMLKVDPAASAADKEKARAKLLGIKKDIEAAKISFAEAANKFSEDPANSDGAGGDVGYFGLSSGFIEEFANAAFALPRGKVSEVVETPYGLHIIEVTERKEGGPVDPEQDKPRIKQVFAADLQRQVLTAERKNAKVDIKPMPADLFPSQEPAPAPAQTPAPAAGATKKDAGK